MPEQEGQGKGKADGAMVAGEGVVRRVVQEVIAYAGDKRPIVRIEVADRPRHGQADRQRQHQLKHHLPLGRPPQPQGHHQQGHDQNQIFSDENRHLNGPLRRGRGCVEQGEQRVVNIFQHRLPGSLVR